MIKFSIEKLSESEWLVRYLGYVVSFVEEDINYNEGIVNYIHIENIYELNENEISLAYDEFNKIEGEIINKIKNI